MNLTELSHYVKFVIVRNEVSEMDEKDKIEALAIVIKDLLQQVDVFTQVLTSNDFKLLETAADSLYEMISYKQSAATLLYAIGGNPDTEDDEYKLKTLNKLVDLMKLRIEYRERVIKKQKENRKRQEALKMFQDIGLC